LSPVIEAIAVQIRLAETVDFGLLAILIQTLIVTTMAAGMTVVIVVVVMMAEDIDMRRLPPTQCWSQCPPPRQFDVNMRLEHLNCKWMRCFRGRDSADR